MLACFFNHTSAHVFTRVLDSLPSIMGPLIEGVGEAVGMHVTVLIGGPEPKMQGQLNTIRSVSTSLWFTTFNSWRVYSMHYGFDKQAVPKVWGQADKAGFKLVTNTFTSFLQTCYCRYSEFSGDYVTDVISLQHLKSNGRAPLQKTPKMTYHIPLIGRRMPLNHALLLSNHLGDRRPRSRS